MSRLAPVLGIAHALFRTPIERARRGPLRPGWSFGYEVIARFMNRDAERLAKLDLVGQRRAREAQAALILPVSGITREKAELDGVPGEWFRPRAPGPGAILYLHGGAYIYGSPRLYANVVGRLARAAGLPTFCAEYRLAPEHPFPAALEDALACYRAMIREGRAPSELVVAGDSAGGGLTLALLLSLKAAGEPLPAGALLLSPWVDLAATGGTIARNVPYDYGTEAELHRWAQAYAHGRDLRDPLISPLHGELSGLCPLAIEVGGAELLLDQVTALAARARTAGVPIDFRLWGEQIHDSYFFASIFPDCARAIDRLGGLARGFLEGGATEWAGAKPAARAHG